MNAHDLAAIGGASVALVALMFGLVPAIFVVMGFGVGLAINTR